MEKGEKKIFFLSLHCRTWKKDEILGGKGEMGP